MKGSPIHDVVPSTRVHIPISVVAVWQSVYTHVSTRVIDAVGARLVSVLPKRVSHIYWRTLGTADVVDTAPGTGLALRQGQEVYPESCQNE